MAQRIFYISILTTIYLILIHLPSLSPCIANFTKCISFKNYFVELLNINATEKDSCFLQPNASHFRRSNSENNSNVSTVFSKSKDSTNKKLIYFHDNIERKISSLKHHLESQSNDKLRKHIYTIVLYNSLSLAGSTLTLKQMRFILESELAVGEKSLKEHNQVLGLNLAFHYVKNLIKKNEILVEHLIEMNKRLVGYTDPLKAGSCRDKETSKALKEYVFWVNSNEKAKIHPLVFTSIILVKFKMIRPFEKSNNLMGILLLNLFLLRKGYPLIMINNNDKQVYFNNLNKAIRGNVDTFTDFIASCIDRSINVYLSMNNDSFDEIE